MILENWVVDVSFWTPGHKDMLCFIPMEGTLENPVYVVGMNLLTSPEGFNQGNLVGIIHSDGQEAVDKWCDEHPDLMKRLSEIKEKIK